MRGGARVEWCDSVERRYCRQDVLCTMIWVGMCMWRGGWICLHKVCLDVRDNTADLLLHHEPELRWSVYRSLACHFCGHSQRIQAIRCAVLVT